MKLQNLIKQYAQTLFTPDGQDESGVYMVVGDYRLHVRNDDAVLIKGMPLSDVWALVDNVTQLR